MVKIFLRIFLELHIPDSFLPPMIPKIILAYSVGPLDSQGVHSEANFLLWYDLVLFCPGTPVTIMLQRSSVTAILI